MVNSSAASRLAVLGALALLLVAGCRETRPAPVVVATTTSVADAGLLDALRSAFLADSGIEVDTFVVGSGKALAMARNGRVDIAITHEPRGEAELLASGRAVAHRDFLENRFLLVGPRGAVGAESVTVLDAMRVIHEKRTPFVSRGDASGTHARELELWRLIGVDPAANPRYQSLGQGMAALLRSADELRACTLTDEATYARFRSSIELVPLATEGDGLRNVYRITLVRRERGEVNASASAFYDWLASPSGTRAIEEFLRAHRGFRLPQRAPKGSQESG
jgi:tungstate transport system substrate-binding protein